MQVPSWAGTPPGQVHPGQVHLPGRYTPSNACWDTVNKPAVRILLECILVCFIFSFVFHKPVKESDIFVLFYKSMYYRLY